MESLKRKRESRVSELPSSKESKKEDSSVGKGRESRLATLGQELADMMRPQGDCTFGSDVQIAFRNIQVHGQTAELNLEEVMDDSLSKVQSGQWQQVELVLNELGITATKVQLPASWEKLTDDKSSLVAGLNGLTSLQTVVVDAAGSGDAQNLNLANLREGLNIEVSFANLRQTTNIAAWIPEVPANLRPTRQQVHDQSPLGVPFSQDSPARLDIDSKESAGDFGTEENVGTDVVPPRTPPLSEADKNGDNPQPVHAQAQSPSSPTGQESLRSPQVLEEDDGNSPLPQPGGDDLEEVQEASGDLYDDAGGTEAGTHPGPATLQADLYARLMAHSSAYGAFSLHGSQWPEGKTDDDSRVSPGDDDEAMDGRVAAGETLAQAGEPTGVQLPVAQGSWTFTVPTGSRVYATGVQTEGVAMMEKSRVVYGTGPDAPVLPLGGLVYWRGAGGESTDSDSKGLKLTHQHPLGLNLNGHVALSGNPSEPIACQHLALQWIYDRITQHMNKTLTTEKLRYSYDNYQTAEAIRAHMDPEIEKHVENLVAGRRSPVDAQSFGDMLADQFGQMHPGDNRYFLLGTTYENVGEQNNGSSGHMLAVELRYKPAEGTVPARYVVNLYDPNHTRTHQRTFSLEPADLQGKSIAHWLDETRLDTYFPLEGDGGGDERSMGTLYRVEPGIGGAPVGPATDTKQHLPQDTKLLTGLQPAPPEAQPFGSKAYVKSLDQLRACIAEVHFGNEPKLLGDVISWVAGTPGLDSAQRRDLLGAQKLMDNVAGYEETYRAGIQDLPEEIMNEADRARLLSLVNQ